MTWGTVTVAGFDLREETDAREEAGGTLKVYGQEAHPPRTRAHVDATQANIRSLAGRTVSVSFTDKAELTGFYRVTAATTDLHKWANGAVQTATWTLDLMRVGASADVEIESRVPTVGRLTDHAVSPVFWHAPVPGTRTYFTGATVPASIVTRTGADGPVPVHLGIPAGVAPRWMSSVTGYAAGGVRLLFDGSRRIGTDTPPLSVWELSNGLMRVQPTADGVTLSVWDSLAWRSAQALRFAVSGTVVADQPELSILRNDPEEVIVRLTYPGTPGRLMVDLGMRRGSRFITGVVKRHSAASLAVRTSPDRADGATVTGGTTFPADVDGNIGFIGSARSHTALGTGGISKSAVTRLDFFAGLTVGPAPAAGDAFADLLAQYLGSAGDTDRVIQRGIL